MLDTGEFAVGGRHRNLFPPRLVICLHLFRLDRVNQLLSPKQGRNLCSIHAFLRV